MKSKHTTPHLHKGFTMVELLVVITIIAVLAVIGFTGARKLIDSASKAKSMGNIKQLISVSQLFSTDQNGAIMNWNNTEATIGGVTAKRNWSHNMLLTLSPDLAMDNNYQKSAGDAFAREIGLFTDPKALKEAKSKLPKSGHDSWRTFAYNNRIGVAKVDFPGQIPYAQGAKNVQQVDAPGRLVLLSQRVLEGGQYFSFLQPEDGSTGKIGFKLYNGSAMVGFFDGHVELFTRKNYPSWGGTSTRTGEAYANTDMNEFWFGRSTPYPAP
jgi:prepilin-type N-terminal cleavage/methylation domain-containing protein/prepilin-type processing-associated H-X9-DG protein